MFTLYRIHVAFAFVQKSYHTGFLFTHKNGDFVVISVTKLYWSQKWSITNWIGSMLHFGAVWTSSLSIVEVNKYEKRLEPFETEANKQEWGLGFSSQTLLANLSSTMFNVFKQLVPILCRHCSLYTRELFELVWKAIQQSVKIALDLDSQLLVITSLSG